MGLFTTECDSCVFNQGICDTVCCSLNRYEKFKNMGCVDVDKPTKIHKLCTACRNTAWKEKFEEEGINKQLENELKNVYTLMIVDEEKDGKVLDRLKESLKYPQNIKPKQIIVAYEGEDNMSDINHFMRDEIKDGIKYTINRIESQTYPREIIDIAAKKVVGMFYLIQQNGIKLNPYCFDRLYEYIEVLLKQVLLVVNEPNRFESYQPYHSMMVNYLCHKHYNGNVGETIEEKAYNKIKKDKEFSWLVSTWNEIYRACKQIKDNTNESNSSNS